MEWRFWNRKPEKRDLNYVNPNMSSGLLFGAMTNNGGALNISAAYRCTELISDAVASLPVQVKYKDGDGTSNILTDHYANLLFDDRNGNILTKYTFLKMLVQSVILKGNGFAYIHRADDGTPISLQFLEASDVVINYIKEKNELYYQIPIIKSGRIKPKEVLHFVKNSYNGVQGISVISYAKRSLDISNGAENTANNFFSNGCQLSGIISCTTQLSKEQREQILTSWNTTYSQGGRGVAVLPGNMEYQPISLNSADAELLSSRQYNVEDVARFFGVNPVMLGLANHATYASLEMVQQDFMMHTLMPYIVMIEAELSRKLLRADEKNTKIILDMEAILRATKSAQAEYLTKLRTNGIMSVNECRTQLGLPSVDGGDELLIAYTDINQNKINQNTEDNGEKQ